MTAAGSTVLIMAGGTGGHVYPALAVAERLREQGVAVRWLGTRGGLEARVVPANGFAIDFISTVGIRGKGVWNAIKACCLMFWGLLQSLKVIMEAKPMAVLGMGGFVSVPGALASYLLRKPLLIHEQNAVAGSANRLLRRFASKVMQGFDQALAGAECTGNPVRQEIVALHQRSKGIASRLTDNDELHLLVLGGSLGAKAINDVLPGALKEIFNKQNVRVCHQTGKTTYEATLAAYREQQLSVDGERLRVTSYIEDMASMYEWADLVLCRAGAMTLAEVTCASLPSILVPLPNAIDDHQNKNAMHLVERNAALLMPQKELSTDAVVDTLTALLEDRSRLVAMSAASRALAPVQATQRVADACLQQGGVL